MCGFVGIVSKNKLSTNLLSSLDNAALKIKSRGPDFTGKWINKKKNFATSHNRLSIIDISSNGNQPMHSQNEKYTIVYNGELYNFLEIKEKIFKDFNYNSWKSSSDTEVFLKAIELYGVEASLKLFCGMFSFALWDNMNEILYLARDIAGEKPLYYFLNENNFIFASQIKCFKDFGFDLSVDENSVRKYLYLNYIPSPDTIFKEIKKISPGHLLICDHKNNKIENKQFFSKENEIASIENTKANNLDKFDDILKKVINQQLVADVPVGVFLSGGLDSSLIASVASSICEKKIDTFNISQTNKNYDESNNANLVSKIINSNHHEILIDKQKMLSIVDEIPKIYDEPFADSSQIPTAILCREVSAYGKVFLTGDGGDEIFGGYNRYIFISFFNKYIKKLHPSVRAKINKLVYSLIKINSKILDNLFFNFFQNFNSKLFKISKVLDLNDSNLIYRNLIGNFHMDKLTNNSSKMNLNINTKIFENKSISDEDKFMNQDFEMYLPDDIFVKTDRASMYYSIETRSPFVDKRIINFAKNLSSKEKINGFKSKVIIRNLLKKYIPKNFISKKKMGFGLPLEDLIRDDLKDYCYDSIQNLSNHNISSLNLNIVRETMKKHMGKHRDYSFEIWNLVMLSQWFQKYNND